MKIFGFILVLVFLMLIIIYGLQKISVYPTIYFLRFIERFNKSSVNVSTYETDVSLVSKKRTIFIEDDNLYSPLPPVSVSTYGLENVKSKQALVLFIHGGGWSLGDESQLADYAKLIASNGYLVASPNYALAPENAYPTSTRQLVLLLNHLYLHADKYQIDARNIFLMGNSAGAHLAAQCAALINDETYSHQVNVKPLIPKESLKGLILFNGVYDFNALEDVNFPFLSNLAWAYTGRKDYKSFDKIDEMSPINYVNKEFPNTFITVGDQDPLYNQSDLFVKKLQKENITYEAMLWEKGHDLNHDYMYDLSKDESKQVYDSVIEFIDKNVK